MAKGQVVEMVVDEVASNLEEAATVARSFDPKAIRILGLGLGVGLVVGFTVGYVWRKKKLADEAFSKGEAEIEKIRDMYKRNDEAFKVVSIKPNLEDVVEERGYSQRVTEEEIPRPTKPPVPVTPASHFTSAETPKRKSDTEKDKYDNWDWQQEMLDRRNTERPFIIHQDEFFNRESELSQLSCTYYSIDEILTDAATDEKINDPNSVVGAANLERFGHGTDDWDVLYVRNEESHMEYEICRINKSYEEEVEGIVRDISDDETDDGTD